MCGYNGSNNGVASREAFQAMITVIDKYRFAISALLLFPPLVANLSIARHLWDAVRVNSLNPLSAKLSTRDHILVSYVDYQLDPPTKLPRLLHEEICRWMLVIYREALQEAQENEEQKLKLAAMDPKASSAATVPVPLP
jgi:hypothetical protein